MPNVEHAPCSFRLVGGWGVVQHPKRFFVFVPPLVPIFNPSNTDERRRVGVSGLHQVEGLGVSFDTGELQAGHVDDEARGSSAGEGLNTDNNGREAPSLDLFFRNNTGNPEPKHGLAASNDGKIATEICNLNSGNGDARSIDFGAMHAHVDGRLSGFYESGVRDVGLALRLGRGANSGVSPPLSLLPRTMGVQDRGADKYQSKYVQRQLRPGRISHALLGLEIGLFAGAFALLAGWGLFNWREAKTRPKQRIGGLCLLVSLFGALCTLWVGYSMN